MILLATNLQKLLKLCEEIQIYLTSTKDSCKFNQMNYVPTGLIAAAIMMVVSHISTPLFLNLYHVLCMWSSKYMETSSYKNVSITEGQHSSCLQVQLNTKYRTQLKGRWYLMPFEEKQALICKY